MTYWKWFRHGSGGPPGFRSVLNVWTILHFVLGCALAVVVPVALPDAANTVLLPLFGVFVGISFAWAGNAHALLLTPQIDKIARETPGGFTGYVFLFQTAILVLLTTLVGWGLAGLNVFGAATGPFRVPSKTGTVAVLLYTALSISIRECWHVVLATQSMLLAWREVQTAESDDDTGRTE